MTKRHSFRAASFLFSIFVFLFSGSLANAQTDRDDDRLTDDGIKKLLEENRIPALGIGVITGGKLTQVKVYGELRKGEAAPFNTIFNVASLTKPVTAMIALRLASAGKLNLDEPLDKYWIDPDIKTNARHKKFNGAANFVAPDRLSELALVDKIEKAGIRVRAGNEISIFG